ncbi:MAG: MFS transporter, partial [Halobacteria archaeon]|nr:MFS transporter [Halobacteria archaeon]
MNANDRSIVGVVMLAHATVHTYELSIPILMTIWIERFGVTPATMGAVAAVGYALFGLGSLPAGVLADMYGSRRLILVCLAAMGGSFVLLSVSTGVVVIAVALALWGAGASLYHPSGLSLISTGVEERGKGFAYHGIAGNAGIALGPLATTVALLFLGWRSVVVLLGLPALVATLLVLGVGVDEEAAVEREEADFGGSGERGDLSEELRGFAS